MLIVVIIIAILAGMVMGLMRTASAWTAKAQTTERLSKIRAAIAVRHGVTVRDVLLTPAGAMRHMGRDRRPRLQSRHHSMSMGLKWPSSSIIVPQTLCTP